MHRSITEPHRILITTNIHSLTASEPSWLSLGQTSLHRFHECRLHCLARIVLPEEVRSAVKDRLLHTELQLAWGVPSCLHTQVCFQLQTALWKKKKVKCNKHIDSSPSLSSKSPPLSLILPVVYWYCQILNCQGVVTPIRAVLRAVIEVTAYDSAKTACDCMTTLLNCWWPCDRGKNPSWPQDFL